MRCTPRYLFRHRGFVIRRWHRSPGLSKMAGIPTMMISVDPAIFLTRVRPPRTAYYKGEFG